MFKVLKSENRGHANHGWLDSHFSFSFANYHNPKWMGFKTLRVINQDIVEAGQGFGNHPHQDMEIISYVLEGALEHKDSMGNGSIIKQGDVQRMTAGTGVLHSEFNPSESEAVEFLQIWILPDRKGLEPAYEQKSFSKEQKHNQLRLIASADGRDDSLKMNQQASIYASILDSEVTLNHLLPKKCAWIQIIDGVLIVNERKLKKGDGAAISDIKELEIKGVEQTEFLLFEL